jgi:hypothetical protein
MIRSLFSFALAVYAGKGKMGIYLVEISHQDVSVIRAGIKID